MTKSVHLSIDLLGVSNVQYSLWSSINILLQLILLHFFSHQYWSEINYLKSEINYLKSEIPLETMLFPILIFVNISASSSWNKTLVTPSPTPVFV